MQLSRNVVVASIQVDLRDDILARFQADLLGRVEASEPRAVILDVSGLETLDSEEFAALRRIAHIVTIMGTESIVVGLQPGVVSALIEMNANVEDLKTAIDLDAAFELLDPEPRAEPGSDTESTSEDDPADASTPDSEQILEQAR
jgi:rsbT antagonist protein RsbS